MGAKLEKPGDSSARLLRRLAGEAAERIGDFGGRQLQSLAWALGRVRWRGPRSELLHVLGRIDGRAAQCLDRGQFREPHELSLVLWAFGRLGRLPEALMGRLELRLAALPLLRRFGPQEVANTAWALARLGRGSERLLQPLAARAAAVVPSGSPKEVATTLWAFASLRHSSADVERLVEAAAARWAPRLGEFTPRDLATVAWACGTLGPSPGTSALAAAVASCAAPRLDGFEPRSLSTFVVGMARLGSWEPCAAAGVLGALRGRVHLQSPVGLANLAWALARLDLPPSDDLEAVLEEIAATSAPRAREFDAKSMVCLMWGLQSTQHRSAAVVRLAEATGAEAVRRRDELTAHGVASLLRSAARLSTGSTYSGGARLAGGLKPRALELCAGMTAQDVSNTCWACARVGFADKELLGALEARALQLVGAFSPQGLSNTLWAYATLSVYPEGFISAVAIRAVQGSIDLRSFSEQSLANLAWAFARLEFVAPRAVMRAIAAAAVPRLGSFQAHSICSLVRSAADVLCPMPPLFEAVDAEVLSRLPEFRGANAETLLQSYSRVGHRSAAVLPLLGQAAEDVLQSIAAQAPGLDASARSWDVRRRRHYTALMVEAFCSGTLPNIPNLQSHLAES
uniref:Protein of clr family n=1 Tax=Tetraselmis sp. GSL018 TaxID=582737 RepID=A0A061SCY4_9CHLO